MTRFVEQAIEKAGLLPVLEAHRTSDMQAAVRALPMLREADLLALGAVADMLRADDVGATVHIWETARAHEVIWVAPGDGASELDVLRGVAIARICGEKGARIGIDWSTYGLELAQVALGFGASDLRGPIMRKSGLLIRSDETRKVKGLGMVELRSIRKREIEALVTHAGRIPVFVEEPRSAEAHESTQEVAGV